MSGGLADIAVGCARLCRSIIDEDVEAIVRSSSRTLAVALSAITGTGSGDRPIHADERGPRRCLAYRCDLAADQAATGILIGELALALPDSMPLIRLGLAAFVAMLAAASYGLPAVVPIQAGVSAILVVTFGTATTGSVRMADVAIGALVGLVFSYILPAPRQSQRAKAD
jgi:hypothetical protein